MITSAPLASEIEYDSPLAPAEAATTGEVVLKDMDKGAFPADPVASLHAAMASMPIGINARRFI
ncbi:MAG TPA: hypothetical protein VFK13_10645 [Gemmatimonadaceae bacterium]|nr:hypothetical protein [Gemmatimonadaceae bacterium]